MGNVQLADAISKAIGFGTGGVIEKDSTYELHKGEVVIVDWSDLQASLFSTSQQYIHLTIMRPTQRTYVHVGRY
jgi:hypothetical protein